MKMCEGISSAVYYCVFRHLFEFVTNVFATCTQSWTTMLVRKRKLGRKKSLHKLYRLNVACSIMIDARVPCRESSQIKHLFRVTAYPMVLEEFRRKKYTSESSDRFVIQYQGYIIQYHSKRVGWFYTTSFQFNWLLLLHFASNTENTTTYNIS